ncbi:hypothetical protein IW261DRAFT_529951 [Armillaria novae-zelandiae]|uniref:Secreted protein n=1 Tax=Armillaria novae-zelandiae TaxID=153914 RepID=A0AA39NZQ5_9AGAR|nr:hypothetical protein IW261DRAFT_529951 [Armillaria novae-zelandiae]
MVRVPFCMGVLLALCLSWSFLWLEGVGFWDRDRFIRPAQASCRNWDKCQHFSPWPRVTASTLDTRSLCFIDAHAATLPRFTQSCVATRLIKCSNMNEQGLPRQSQSRDSFVHCSRRVFVLK